MRSVGETGKADGYYEVSVSVGHEAMEAVADFLVREGSGGVVYDEEGGVATVKAYFRPDVLEDVVARLNEHLAALPLHGLDPGDARVGWRFVPDADWAEAWRAFYKVRRVGERIVVRPVWEDYTPRPGEVVIDMDPGMAFGTGEHPTTMLCLEVLDELVTQGTRVADVGTGSGILAVAAAKLGAAEVDAVDIDPEAVQVAADNVRANGVEEKVRLRVGDVSALAAFGPAPYDVIVMNIVTDVIIAALPTLTAHLGAGARLVLSGIIDSRLDDVETAVTEAGLRVLDVRRRAEWVLVVAGR